MSDTTVINIFKSDNSNITYIKTQHCQIMVTITYRILKFEPMIKKLILINCIFFTVITFSNTAFVRPSLHQFEKNFH